MDGLCGWVGGMFQQAEAQTLLEKMAGRFAIIPEQRRRHHASPTQAVAAAGHPDTSGIFADDRLWIAITGDVYWENEELNRLAQTGGVAAAVAHIYLRDGIRCLENIRGPFSLALMDRRQGQTLLAIDRLGIHRLCFAIAGDQLVFGARADSVAQHPATPGEINPQAIFDYLYFHAVPAPHSIYRGQQKLLPGQYVIFRAGKLEQGFYWQLPFQDESTVPATELAEEFRRLLRKAVRRASHGVQLGSFLSGGTDSSTVAGVLTEVNGRAAETFSIGFQAAGYDETHYARIAAKHFGTHHHEYYVTPEDVTNAVSLIAQTYDEPFGNASAVPTYYCAKFAREHGVATLLAGDGGDEIFAGNARYAKQEVFELYGRLPGALRNGVIEPLALLPGAGALSPLRKLRSYIEQARIPLPDRLESYNFLHRCPLDEIFAPEFLRIVNPEQPLELLREVYGRTRSLSSLNRMLHLDLKITLADNDLRKVRGMCELAGVNVRFPMLDEEIVEFSGRVPAALKLKGRQLRYFFKEALRDFLPPETLSKTKHGFGLPTGLWLKEHPPLRQLARQSLDAFTQRGYLRPRYVERIWHLHQGEHASYYGVMIWAIMMLEQWLAAGGL